MKNIFKTNRKYVRFFYTKSEVPGRGGRTRMMDWTSLLDCFCGGGPIGMDSGE